MSCACALRGARCDALGATLGIALGVEEVVKELHKLSKKISTTEEITQVRVVRVVCAAASHAENAVVAAHVR